MNSGLKPPDTLSALLQIRAEQTPTSSAFFIDGKSYSYEWLWNSSLRFSNMLKDKNVKKKERIIILVPNSAGFFTAFYGCILCGAIAVPVFPESGVERIHQLALLSGSRHIIIPENIIEGRRHEFIAWAESRDIVIHWLTEFQSSAQNAGFSLPSSDDIAFIQYTSGSTDFPKGVPLTHNNVITNIIQMTEALMITEDDVFISWLPVYHDMGLILNTMVPFYTRARLVLLKEGLHKVHTWLKTIEAYKGTIISGPDIAYRLCAKSIHNPADYDLSSLRVALNASEPIHLQTYRLFEETFNLKNVMISGYGLAEATVAVTIHPPSQPPETDSEGYVSSGKPLKGIEIQILSGSDRVEKLPSGEILVKSPALMKGYFNTSEIPEPIDQQGYLHTGDIGYLDPAGNLYILGRKKNIIIQAGHTLYPDDIEEVVKSVEDVRNAAAIGIEDSRLKTESLIIFAESRVFKYTSDSRFHEIAILIVEKIYAHFGLKPGKVFILKPKTLPITHNGKLQHAILKKQFLTDFHLLSKNILYPKSHPLAN